MKDGLAVLLLKRGFAVGPDKSVSMAARGACVAQFWDISINYFALEAIFLFSRVMMTHLCD